MRGLVPVVLVAGTGEDVAEGAGAVDAIEEPGSAEADLPVGLDIAKLVLDGGLMTFLWVLTMVTSSCRWPDDVLVGLDSGHLFLKLHCSFCRLVLVTHWHHFFWIILVFFFCFFSSECLGCVITLDNLLEKTWILIFSLA